MNKFKLLSITLFVIFSLIYSISCNGDDSGDSEETPAGKTIKIFTKRHSSVFDTISTDTIDINISTTQVLLQALMDDTTIKLEVIYHDENNDSSQSTLTDFDVTSDLSSLTDDERDVGNIMNNIRNDTSGLSNALGIYFTDTVLAGSGNGATYTMGKMRCGTICDNITKVIVVARLADSIAIAHEIFHNLLDYSFRPKPILPARPYPWDSSEVDYDTEYLTRGEHENPEKGWLWSMESDSNLMRRDGPADGVDPTFTEKQRLRVDDINFKEKLTGLGQSVAIFTTASKCSLTESHTASVETPGCWFKVCIPWTDKCWRDCNAYCHNKGICYTNVPYTETHVEPAPVYGDCPAGWVMN